MATDLHPVNWPLLGGLLLALTLSLLGWLGLFLLLSSVARTLAWWR